MTYILIAYTLVGCVSFHDKPKGRFTGQFIDSSVNQKKGYNCLFEMDVNIKTQAVSDNILPDGLSHGSIRLYKKVGNGGEQEGSDFYVTNLTPLSRTTCSFKIIYAGVNGVRTEVYGCRLIRQDDKEALIKMGQGWPFASEYNVRILRDSMFDSEAFTSQQKTTYGFSFEKPYAADRFMFDYFSKYQWLIIAAFVLALIYFICKSAFSHIGILIAMAAICFVSVVHSWTLAYPVVLPFSVALISMTIPYIRKYAETIYVFLLVISALFTIYGLWQECGFFLFLWKAFYIFFCSMYATIVSFVIFTKRCPRCGDFTVSGCYRRKEYFAAEDILSIRLNSNGVLAKKPEYYYEDMEEKKEETCYWCTHD